MFIKFEYTSQMYTEILGQLRGAPDAPLKVPLKTKDYNIDLQNNAVTKINVQKLKFEALYPFASEQTVKFLNNSYIIQVRIKNCSSNRMFIEKLEFKNKVSKDLELIDLNYTIPT